MSVLSLRPAHQAFVEPCLPTRTAHPPLGPGWLHEIKYDGFRLRARRDARSVRLLTRRGYDWTQRFRLIADAISGLRCHSCLIDGEAVACDEGGIPVFKLLVRNRMYASAQLYAFDLLELDGEDLRGEPIERRKHALTQLLGKDRAGLLISPSTLQLISPSNLFANSAWKASCRRRSARNTSLADHRFG